MGKNSEAIHMDKILEASELYERTIMNRLLAFGNEINESRNDKPFM